MIKRILIFTTIFLIFSAAVFSAELGLIFGSINKPSEAIYGFSAGSGMLVPLLKFEVEYYNLADRKYEALTLGVKLRKRFRKIAPYGVIGVGTEVEYFTFDVDEFDSFLFVGGGIHYYIAGIFSIRADLRFQNFKDISKTRFSVGIFAHL